MGWNFDFPFRKGGSSRYLTMGIMFLPKKYSGLPKDIIKSLYDKFKWKNEKKASHASLNQKILFCEKAVELLKGNKEIIVDVITASKENVQDHIRKDPNKLYNFMAGLVVPENLGKFKHVDFIPDERSVKVKSGNSLADYLQIKVWFELKLETKLHNKPAVSHMNYNLQFVDWISHCVWANFEDKIDKPFTLLQPHIRHRKLYFKEG